MSGSPTIHCELGPVLVNRTAVYRICRQVPGELTRRGIDARAFALLAKLDCKGNPDGWWQRRRFQLSQRYLRWALAHPGRFLLTRPWMQPFFRHRRRGTLPLVLDPLYLLFHTKLLRGVVVVYDTTPVTTPDWHSPGAARLYQAAFKRLALEGCHVVACSRNTADHLRVNHGIAPSRLTVLPLGLIPSAPSPPSESVQEPFLLFVGNIEPRKNVPGLLRAYLRANLYPRHGVRLRIVGAVCDPRDPVVAQAHSITGVDLLGFGDEEVLAASYRDCLGFVYPSFCEGFGLPLLEAMDRGCVCLATRAGASPEVGGDAVLYVNPHCDEDIAAGMVKLVQMPAADRDHVSRRARQRARIFSWDRFYDGLAHVLRTEARRCFAGSGGVSCGAGA